MAAVVETDSPLREHGFYVVFVSELGEVVHLRIFVDVDRRGQLGVLLDAQFELLFLVGLVVDAAQSVRPPALLIAYQGPCPNFEA